MTQETREYYKERRRDNKQRMNDSNLSATERILASGRYYVDEIALMNTNPTNWFIDRIEDAHQKLDERNLSQEFRCYMYGILWECIQLKATYVD